MVRSDGQIGSVPESTVAAVSVMPVASVQPRPDLDALFVAGKQKIEGIDFSKRSFTKDEFLRALQGFKGTDVRPMLAEVEKDLQLRIAEEHPEFRAKAATR